MLFWPRSPPNGWLPQPDGIRHRNSEREYLVTLPLANEYISLQKRILRFEDEFWRILTDTVELADAERKALRTYLGFWCKLERLGFRR
jgi:hypothetical protein